MPRVIELIAESPPVEYWAAKALCPMSGETSKSILCPRKDLCELPIILIKAQDAGEAEFIATKARLNKTMPLCDNRWPYGIRSELGKMDFQPCGQKDYIQN
jgi:hypothetical protein